MPVSGGGNADPIGISNGYADLPGYTPTPAETELKGTLTSLLLQSKQVKLPFERTWEWNLAYKEGSYQIYQNKSTGEIFRRPMGAGERMWSNNNRIKATSRSLTGKLAQMRPAFVCKPKSQEQDAIFSARVIDAFIQYIDYAQDIPAKYVKMMQYLAWAGTAIIDVDWNNQGGDKLAWCKECQYTFADLFLIGQPCPHCQMLVDRALAGEAERLASEMTAVNMGLLHEDQIESPSEPPPVPTLIEIREGAVESHVIDPRDWYPDPVAIEPETIQYDFTRYIRRVSTVRARFPEKAGAIRPTLSSYVAGPTPNRPPAAYGSWGTGLVGLVDATVYWRYREMPTTAHPQGRIIYFNDNAILEEQDGWFDVIGRLPVYLNWWDRVPQTIWSDSYIAQAWSRQKDLNMNETTLLETQESFRPRLVTFGLGGVTTDEILGTSMTLQARAQNLAPKWLETPNVPQFMYSQNAIYKDDIRFQAGVTAQEDASAAGNLNGRVLGIIEAESSRQLGPMFTLNALEWREFTRCEIYMHQKFVSKQKKFSIASDEGLSIYSFNDVRYDAGLDLVLEMEDWLSKNPAIRQQQVLNLKAGFPELFVDPATGTPNAKLAARLLKVKIPGASMDLTEPEYAAANAMIKALETGQGPVYPRLWDNPVLFAQTLRAWLGTVGRLPTTDPQLVGKIEALWMYYTQVSQGIMGHPPDVFGGEPQSGGNAGPQAPGTIAPAPPQIPGANAGGVQGVTNVGGSPAAPSPLGIGNGNRGTGNAEGAPTGTRPPQAPVPSGGQPGPTAAPVLNEAQSIVKNADNFGNFAGKTAARQES